jgi:TPR repeat protein
MSFEMSIDDELADILTLMEVDRPAGLAELRRLAEAENRSAILCLGLYLSEDGLTDDEAIPWLLRAFGFDSADAAWNLAMIARQRKDPAAMRKWIDKAAALGQADAIEVQDAKYDVASVLALPCEER